MRSRVDKIRERDQRGGETDRGAIERRHQDLRVVVEGRGDVEVVHHESAHESPARAAGDVLARGVVAGP